MHMFKLFNGFVVFFWIVTMSTTASAQSTIYFVHSDHLGTPQVLTDKDQNVVWKVEEQLPFGEVAESGSISQPIRFPGQYADEETGYSYNYFRDYDPSLGRYLQSDPIGLQGGLNTYGYVFQNPTRFIDPLGLQTTVIYSPGGIDHTAVHIDNPLGEPMLYDPNGDYQYERDVYGDGSEVSQYRPRNDVFNGNGANLDKYKNYHNQNFGQVETFSFNTTPQQEAEIAKRLDNVEGGGNCSIETANAINGIGPFKDLGNPWFPWTLRSSLNSLKGSR